MKQEGAMKRLTRLMVVLMMALSLSACEYEISSGDVTLRTGEAGVESAEDIGAKQSETVGTEWSGTDGAELSEDIALCSPADLQGVWLQVSAEPDGYAKATLADDFNSLIFRTEGEGDEQILRVSSESGDYSGFVAGGRYYEYETEVLDEPIACDYTTNKWSVRIGEEAARSEYGYPLEMETYVTLLDQNTLLQQRCFSYEEGREPGVSYQTYRRILAEASDDLTREDLDGCGFELEEFISFDGGEAWIDDFTISFDEYGYYFSETFDDGSTYNGFGSYWEMGEGGTLLTCGSYFLGDCYAGAVSNVGGEPELYLWNAGDLIRLKKIEDQTFEAPKNLVFWIYGDEYLDMNVYQNAKEIPVYSVNDGPNARKVLLTCVRNNTPVWLSDGENTIADFGTLMAGQSIIIQLDFPESNGSHLTYGFGEKAYYVVLDHSNFSMNTRDYISGGDI